MPGLQQGHAAGTSSQGWTITGEPDLLRSCCHLIGIDELAAGRVTPHSIACELVHLLYEGCAGCGPIAEILVDLLDAGCLRCLEPARDGLARVCRPISLVEDVRHKRPVILTQILGPLQKIEVAAVQ